MNQIERTNTEPSRLLGRFGLATIIGIASLAVAFLCLLFPPWLEVECERRKNKLYVPESRQVEVYDKSFAGFDFVLDEAKWTRTTVPVHPVGTTLFKSTEFEIYWRLLVCEWVVLALIGSIGYFKISRRIFKTVQTPS